MLLMVILGTPGNAFMAYTIWKTPHLRSRTNILLAWLNVLDIITGFTTTLFIATYQFLIFVQSNNICNYTRLVGASYTFIKNSIFAVDGIMISIAVDRYIAIVHPLHYQNWITEKWARNSVIISLLFGLSIGLSFAFYLTRVDFTTCALPYSPPHADDNRQRRLCDCLHSVDRSVWAHFQNHRISTFAN